MIADRDDTPLAEGDKVFCEHPATHEAFEGHVVSVEGGIVTVQPAFALFHKKMHRRYVRKI